GVGTGDHRGGVRDGVRGLAEALRGLFPAVVDGGVPGLLGPQLHAAVHRPAQSAGRQRLRRLDGDRCGRNRDRRHGLPQGPRHDAAAAVDPAHRRGRRRPEPLLVLGPL
ncbi:MAG: small multidrug resistance family (SMR) protein, partial [uncultured Blastococcus sp.]